MVRSVAWILLSSPCRRSRATSASLCWRQVAPRLSNKQEVDLGLKGSIVWLLSDLELALLCCRHHEAEPRHRHRSRSGRDDDQQHQRNEFEVGGSEPATRRHRSRPGRSQGFDDGPVPRTDVQGSAPEAVAACELFSCNLVTYAIVRNRWWMNCSERRLSAAVRVPAEPAPYVAPLSIAEQKKKLLWGKKADPVHPNVSRHCTCLLPA